MPVTVVKLGGSLFDLPDLVDRLMQLLFTERVAAAVMIPGGGPFADVVRNLDNVHELNEQAAHQIAVQSLSLSAHLVSNLSPELKLVSVEELSQEIFASKSIPVIDTADFVLKHSPLPHSWDVTSDSIAAWLASLHPESQLLLLKSCPLPAGITPELAAQLGLVDRYFPEIARLAGKIAWCHLRSDSPDIQTWSIHLEESLSQFQG